MKLQTTTALAILIFGFSSAVDVLAQGHTIRGKVRNSSGVNMSQTTVSLESGNGGLINQTVTNNEGDFAFSGLEETSYLITISAPDYNPASERVDFVRKVTTNEPGEMRTVEITMVRKDESPSSRLGVTFVQDVPKEALDSFELGVRLLREGNNQESLVALQKAVSVFPDYFNARFLLATEFIKQEKLNEAIVQLDHARRVNPKDDRVFQAFGMIMMQQQKYAVAARVFAEASHLNPREIQYLLLQGTALIDQATTIDPTNSPRDKNERDYAFGEAEKVLSRAYQLSGEKLPAIHLQLARLYEKRGNRLRAAAELEQYLRQSPDDKKAAEIREAIKKLRATAPKD
jgi:Carboxypeptidase regulatory-like domain/Tetratricopeptide repeat